MNDPVRFVVKSRAQENSWLPVPGFSFYWNLGAVRSSCNGRSSFAGSSLTGSGLRRSGLAGSSLRREPFSSATAEEALSSASAATEVLVEAASEEEAAVEEAEPPQAVMPTARARATTATQTFLSFISKISLPYANVFCRRPYRKCLSASGYSSLFCEKIKSFFG